MKQFHDLARWRTHIFTKLLAIVLVIGTALAIPSMALVIADGMWHIALMDVVALGWIFAIWRSTRLSYTVRVLHFLSVIYLIGVGLMVSIGAVSQIFLMGPPVLAVVLLGRRQGLAVLFLC